jgi:hypothetical protein
LQTQLDTFTGICNQIRAHRALHGATPANAYLATVKAAPAAQRHNPHYRVRHDHATASARSASAAPAACITSASALAMQVQR